MSAKRPELGTVLRRAFAKYIADLRISVPATVLTYDPTARRVLVQPLIRERVLDEAGDWKVERLPAIPGVPVMFQGGGGMHFTFPLLPGDTGLVVFSDSALDTWLSEGGEVDPGEPRAFTINDAVFYPGLASFKDARAAAADHAEIAVDGQPVQGVPMGDTLHAYLEQLRTYIGTLPVTAAGATYAPTAVPEVPAASLLVSSNFKVSR